MPMIDPLKTITVEFLDAPPSPTAAHIIVRAGVPCRFCGGPITPLFMYGVRTRRWAHILPHYRSICGAVIFCGTLKHCAEPLIEEPAK